MAGLSRRLQAIADMVTEGYRLADIGTDHGYIPIWLIQHGRIPSAIAMDVNQGPLDRAADHIREAHLESYIRVKLSDGFSALDENEADCAVIAGMGGSLIIRILREGEKKAERLQELILQPQSDVPSVRKYIRENGFSIQDENMILEDGKYYPIMRIIPAEKQEKTHILSEKEQILSDLFGPVLLKKKHPILISWIEREKSVCGRILMSLPEGETQRRMEIEERKQLLEMAESVMEK